jgi:curved DNA-binding protein CbpA
MPGRRRFIDYYAALKVAPTASADDFRVAYRRLVRRTHPDLNPDDPDAAARTQLIIEAHFVLRDPDRRGAFDARRGVVMERRPSGHCASPSRGRPRHDGPTTRDRAERGGRLRMHTTETHADGRPHDTSVWTVELGIEFTQAGAASLAARARRDGIPAGALATSDHANLTPGSWMVIAGLYETRDLTRRAARRAQLKFDDARPVSVMAGGANGAGPPHSEPDEER